jgi:hypothetical protein
MRRIFPTTRSGIDAPNFVDVSPTRPVSQEIPMSASLTVEYEQGTTHGRARAARRHNGYYAGDFSHAPMLTADELAVVTNMPTPTFAD